MTPAQHIEHGTDLLERQLAEMTAERDKLQAFKNFVHGYLDNLGVPHHPPGIHGAEGCRIGDRMDWLVAERDRLREVNAALLAECKRQRNGQICICNALRIVAWCDEGTKCSTCILDDLIALAEKGGADAV